ncbi:MAG: carbamoyltransferase HypF [Chloroflexota bacterium]|nr:carbamoyltransferase HypF [Chloroflexota bacterium]
MIERRRLTVTGVVQGVGFRPFVFGLASQYDLAGLVGNNSQGVFIEIQGAPASLDTFEQELVAHPPPLAHIETVASEILPTNDDTTFAIVHSQAQATASTLISPDVSLCDDCRRELFDPGDRRFRYPFINCTNCGPRFTIIRDIPYDRPLTTMANFTMCPACQAEYDDPADRRFHAQPNACADCGPQVFFEWSEQKKPAEFAEVEEQSDPIAQARALLIQGGIVAVKGLGGFHLACDATSDEALATLRERKGRVDKPFAVMAVDMETAAGIAQISAEEADLLTGTEGAIVLLRRRVDSVLSGLVAPGNNAVGVMLPYTPLHYLLLGADQGAGRQSARGRMRPGSVLVMTSGNYSDEPIVKDNGRAREWLSGLADAFLFHDRDIHVGCDDSVVRVFRGHELPIRRSRGYAPFPVKLPLQIPPTLAVGGELKSTFCLARDDFAFMSQHIGDMENLETLQAFERAAAHFQEIFRCAPERVVADMHPGYLSTRWAERNAGSARLLKVQHHHAHVAAVMAEHGLDGSRPVIGFSFDGTGYGPDGAIWGGEVLVADYSRFRRVAHLQYVPLAGGDSAIKRPYRVALAHLWAAGEPWDADLPSVAACPQSEQTVLRRQLERGLNTVPTSSMGRLFDAVASLAGVRQVVTYEAQAAIELEAMAAEGVEETYGFDVPSVVYYGDPAAINASPVIRAVVADVRAGEAPAVIAARFHNAVADLIDRLARQLREQTGMECVVLSGGVFQNVTLLALAVDRLDQAGFQVLTHRLVPPNDGGLALGQAIIGGLRADAYVSWLNTSSGGAIRCV